jgi:hypothetical protein
MFCTALLMGASTLTFAADTSGKKVLYSDFSSTYSVPARLKTINVPITQEIRDWFTKNGVDGKLIDSPKATRAVKDDIEVLLNERNTGAGAEAMVQPNLNTLNDLIRPALQTSLDARTADVAVMHIGARVWKLTEITN